MLSVVKFAVIENKNDHYWLKWEEEGAIFFECRDSALCKLMILLRKQPNAKKFCPQNNDRRSVADFPHPVFARWRSYGCPDLISHDELQQKLGAIRQAGITARVIALSNITGAGFDEFHQVLMSGRTYCLLGSSGVGKSTLINHLIGRDALDTKAVSGTGEGTHTTARRQLIVLDKGMMFIDAPNHFISRRIE